jgi:hypothetical protein
MIMKRPILLRFLALSVIGCWHPAAQTTVDYRLAWMAFDAGGGTGTGGVYAATGAVGQPWGGAVTTDSYRSWGGFLSGADPADSTEPCSPLIVTLQPASLASACANDCATFTVGVSGSGPIHAQWYRDGNPIPGAMAMSYSICPVTVADAGVYRVALSNACGNVVSHPAMLVLTNDTTPPAIHCPSNRVVSATSSNGARVEFDLIATDDFSDKLDLSCTPPSGSLFPIGITKVLCTATDSCGNRSTCEFTVEVTEPRAQISIAAANGNLVITWDGCAVLEQADAVTGPWTPVAGATSPYVPSPAGPMRFYRLEPCGE